MKANEKAIVFACDNNYALPLATVIESILSTALDKQSIKFFCLIPESFNNSNKSMITKLMDLHDVCDVTYIDVGSMLSDIDMCIDHISYVTYFRFLIPGLLKEYDRCLYLDVDMIIKGDLSDLYSSDLHGNYLGAVKHPLLFNRDQIGNHKISPNSYFNAGMLLMNLKLMRDKGVEHRLLQEVEHKYKIQDQDILNVICHDKVKYLHLKYNFMIRLKNKRYWKRFMSSFGLEFKQALRHPVIIHYADREKPWSHEGLSYEEDWLNCFRRTPFYTKMNLNRTILKKDNIGFFKSLYWELLLWLR